MENIKPIDHICLFYKLLNIETLLFDFGLILFETLQRLYGDSEYNYVKNRRRKNENTVHKFNIIWLIKSTFLRYLYSIFLVIKGGKR